MLLAGGIRPAAAQTIGGGLTALPTINLSADLLQNGGFEAQSGGFPSGWSTPSGWAVDQVVKRGGSFSYRRSGGAGTAAQTVQVKKGIYNLSGWVKTEGVGSGNAGIRLQLDMRPTLSQWQTTETITGTTDWKFYEVKNVVVPEDMTVSVKLENFGGATGTAWFDDVKLVQQLPQAVDVFLLYPNFRGMLFDDGPQTVRLDVTVTPPGGDLGRYRVASTLKDEATGQVVASQTVAAAQHLVAELNGAAMQYGRAYLATVALVDASSGNAVYTYPAYRVSRAPASARSSMNVAFDAKNRVLLKGKPRFVLGVYDSGGGYASDDAYWENQIWSPTGDRRLDGFRINMYLNYWLGETPAPAIKALMANLQKRGVMYLQTGNCFSQWAAGNNFAIHSSDAYVQDIGAHPGSAGYYTADECKSVLMPGIFEQYKRLRQLDPDSVTFAALFADDIQLWRDAADIISSDPYPMYAQEPAGGYNHKLVAEWTRLTREAVKDARPFMTVLQFFKFTSQGRWPTRQELRNHAYMAIVEGARGLWWWAVGNGAGALAALCPGQWCPERVQHHEDLKAVINEIADLEPALLADDAPGALTGNSQSSAIKTKVKLAGGRGYVFAYNNTNQPVTTTFTWNTAPGTVSVNAEGRSIGASGNSFSDTFGPYQAHVYVIGNAGSGGGNPGGGTPPPPPPPPAAVTFSNPAANATVSGTTTVTMAATGGTGPYTFRLAVDGTQVYAGQNNTFSWNTTTVGDGSHTLTATVTDSAGLSGSTQRGVTVSNTTSTPPPAAGDLRVAFTSPQVNGRVRGTVVVNVWVAGQSGASNAFTLSVGGRQVAAATIPGNHAVLYWDSTGVADGAHTLVATVRDAAGKTGSSTRNVTTVNGVTAPPTTPPPTTPPPPTPPPASGGLTVAFTSPRPLSTVAGTVVTNLWVTGQSGTSNTFTLSVGGQTQTSATIAGNHAVLYWDTRKVADGTHAVVATVRDATGKTGTSSITVTVRNGVASAPTPPASTPPPPPPPPPPSTGSLDLFFTSPNGTVSGTMVVNLWVGGQSTESKTYTLMVDGRVVGTQTSTGNHVWFSVPTTGYTNGTHTLSATVRDASGRTGASSKTVAVSN